MVNELLIPSLFEAFRSLRHQHCHADEDRALQVATWISQVQEFQGRRPSWDRSTKTNKERFIYCSECGHYFARMPLLFGRVVASFLNSF